MIKNSHRDSVGYFPLLMSVCGQLGMGTDSLLVRPPVHWADLCQGPRVRAVIFRNGDGNWSKPAEVPVGMEMP